MKKIFSIFLTVLMLAGICAVTAFADFVGSDEAGAEVDAYSGGTASGDVYISVTGDPIHKYAVDVTFEALVFTYSTGSTWDTEEHQYKVTGEAAWSPAKTVTISNHSDLSVWYSASVGTVSTEYGPISVKFNDTADSIASTEITKCEVGGPATTASFTVGLEGAPTVGQITDKVIGTVTVTISKTSD
jgi:hypothetical protein